MKDYNYSTLAKYYDVIEDRMSSEAFNKVLEKILKKYKIKTITDMTCGTGAQAIYLHQKGYRVTASDYSKDMIDIAQKKYRKIKFHQGDIRTARYPKTDCLISIFNAIGHLSKYDFEKAIKNVAKNLNDDGIYIFDIFNLDFMKKNFIGHEWIDVAKEVDGVKYVRFNNNRLDWKKGIMCINQRTYVQQGVDKPHMFKENWTMQIYDILQLKNLLEKNGFSVVEFLSMDGKKFDKNRSLFILTIAKKITSS